MEIKKYIKEKRLSIKGAMLLCVVAILISCGDAGAGSDTSTASDELSIELKEYPKADATKDKRPEYLALQVTSTSGTGKYIIAVKKASETAPTATEMQDSKGSYIRRVEQLPKYAVIAVFHPIGFDRSSITFESGANKASIKSNIGGGYLLTPSTGYKVYGMADGGDTVRDYNLSISTDAVYTTLKAANSVMDSSMWGIDAVQSITLSVAESPYIVPGAFANLTSMTSVYNIEELNGSNKRVMVSYDPDRDVISLGTDFPASVFNQIIPNTYTEAAFVSDHTRSAYFLFKSLSSPARFILTDTDSSNADTVVKSKFQLAIEQ